MFQPIRTDPPSDLVRGITFVPFLADGRCVLIDEPGGPALPSGEEPHGVDISPALAELARRRLPQWEGRIWTGDAVDWSPPDSIVAGSSRGRHSCPASGHNGREMTLTQLNAFVLVARLGSVTAAANALGVSESAVSQALSALRLHLGDQLVTRGPVGMKLTPGGSRLLATASQIVVLGAEAHAAVRAAQGAPEQLRVVSTSTIAEFMISPLTEAFSKRFPGSVEVSAGVAVTKEMSVLIANRLADVAISSAIPEDPGMALATEPIFKYRLVVVTAGQPRLRGGPRQWLWFVDPSGTDPGSETGQLLTSLAIPEEQVRVFPNQTAAWAAAADGTGVAPAVEHLVTQRLRRGELSRVEAPGCKLDACWHVTLLERQHQSAAASSFRRYLGTPEAMHLMRSPAGGVPPSRFRPPVYVTIWS